MTDSNKTRSGNGTGNGKDYKWVGTRAVRPDGVDKVTGRAKFGADLHLPNMLVGKVLRSPHAHAHIRSIDTSAAAALSGVKAVITQDDFSDQPKDAVQPAGEMVINYRDMVRNVMAREKALYEGHAIAAVAAVNARIAAKALSLIDVDFEVLPHVIDPVAAMESGAPIIQEDLMTEGMEQSPGAMTNIAKRVEFGHGDVAVGFSEADVVIEREFTTQPVHQGYIEPHACVASMTEDGQGELWLSTQGHYVARGHCATLLGLDVSKLRVQASEIGGGFGTLGEILTKTNNNVKYMDFDIAPTLNVADYYLSNVFGRDNVGGYFQQETPVDAGESNRPLNVFGAWQIEALDEPIDLFVNFISFQEMEPEVVQNYLNHVDRVKTKWVLLRNIREGKQTIKEHGFGVNEPIYTEDYKKMLPNYEPISSNVRPFGLKTLDGFHSELLLFERKR